MDIKKKISEKIIEEKEELLNMVEDDLLLKILQKEEENKQLIISLNTLVAKNKNDTKILLNKTRKLSSDLDKIKSYIKWRRIWRVLYWVFVLGSVFGIWYFAQNFLGDFLNWFSDFAPKDFSPKSIIESISSVLSASK